jgi:hypothetical protein
LYLIIFLHQAATSVFYIIIYQPLTAAYGAEEVRLM